MWIHTVVFSPSKQVETTVEATVTVEIIVLAACVDVELALLGLKYDMGLER